MTNYERIKSLDKVSFARITCNLINACMLFAYDEEVDIADLHSPKENIDLCMKFLNKECDDSIYESCKFENVIAPEWIPCSERLPEGNTVVLISFDNGTARTYFQNWESDKRKEPDRDPFEYCDYGMNGKHIFKHAVAWMPLPEPYKPIIDHNATPCDYKEFLTRRFTEGK